MANKRFAVVARNARTQTDGIITGRGVREFGEKSVLYLSDAGEAKEVEQKYGKGSKHHTVNVVQDDRLEWHEKNDKDTDGHNSNVHHYSFGPSRGYSAAWEEFEKRRVDALHSV